MRVYFGIEGYFRDVGVCWKFRGLVVYIFDVDYYFGDGFERKKKVYDVNCLVIVIFSVMFLCLLFE